ncbi:hypothetical protein EMIT0P260_30010 [Pseudomonas sp. IT-P260]
MAGSPVTQGQLVLKKPNNPCQGEMSVVRGFIPDRLRSSRRAAARPIGDKSPHHRFFSHR